MVKESLGRHPGLRRSLRRGEHAVPPKRDEEILCDLCAFLRPIKSVFIRVHPWLKLPAADDFSDLFHDYARSLLNFRRQCRAEIEIAAPDAE